MIVKQLIKYYLSHIYFQIACENGETITFNQIRENAMKCACAFNSLGIKKGDVIATCCSNSFAFSYVLIGASICGAVVTTCNPNYTKGTWSNAELYFISDCNL